MTPTEFESLLQRKELPSICFIYGEESFLVDRAAKKILDLAIDESLKDFNFNLYYGNDSKGVDIVDAARTLPMFTPRRAIHVKRADQLKAEACETLLPYIQNPVDTTCLVFSGTKVDLRKKFFIEFKKNGQLVEYKRIYDNKLTNFIQAEAMLSGKPIDMAAADLLAFLVGNNLQELASQIEKLCIYIGKKQRITIEDVKSMTSNSKAFTAFELAKFIGMHDLHNALKSLDALFLNGEDAPMMIGALSRHFRQLWRVRELIDNRCPQADIGKLLNINSFFLGEMLQQARNYSRSKYRTIFDELQRCDIESKTGKHSYTLMHGLIVTICTNN